QSKLGAERLKIALQHLEHQDHFVLAVVQVQQTLYQRANFRGRRGRHHHYRNLRDLRIPQQHVSRVHSTPPPLPAQYEAPFEQQAERQRQRREDDQGGRLYDRRNHSATPARANASCAASEVSSLGLEHSSRSVSTPRGISARASAAARATEAPPMRRQRARRGR